MKRPVASGLTSVMKEVITMRSSVVPPFVASLCDVSADALPRTFEELFAPLSQGDCVSINAVRATGATIRLTRAILIRPGILDGDSPCQPSSTTPQQGAPRKGPSGNRRSGPFDDGSQLYAAFNATDCLEHIVDQIGRGEAGSLVKAPDSAASLSACGGR